MIFPKVKYCRYSLKPEMQLRSNSERTNEYQSLSRTPHQAYVIYDFYYTYFDLALKKRHRNAYVMHLNFGVSFTLIETKG